MDETHTPHDAKSNLKLSLAPMEGVVDYVVRDLFTQIGGIDWCTTEFIRVTDRLLPEHVFHAYCPELKTQGKTRAGIPVVVQLLGGQAGPLAENAFRASQLGALGIDLNFGCPAKTVNRHDGGATLLKSPDRIFQIVSQVRQAVPKEVPVSAKIRLGFDDPRMCLENAVAVESAGAQKLVVHCRTKTDMYKPPAYWEWIPRMREKVSIPIVANGEIWALDDFLKCQDVTGCQEFMIGRGAFANPFIFQQIKNNVVSDVWGGILSRLVEFYDASSEFKNSNYGISRTKQWLAQIRKREEQAVEVFENLKWIDQDTEFRLRLLLQQQVSSRKPLESSLTECLS